MNSPSENLAVSSDYFLGCLMAVVLSDFGDSCLLISRNETTIQPMSHSTLQCFGSGEESNSYSYIQLPAGFIPGKNPYLPEKVRIWDSGWKEADRATIRRTNIDTILSRPKNAGGSYGLTPASTKRTFLKGSKF
jgi:hypothetical protein